LRGIELTKDKGRGKKGSRLPKMNRAEILEKKTNEEGG